MSRVADGHFLEETRSAVDIEGKHVTIQGPSPDLCPASPFALSTGCHDLLLIRSSMCGHPDPFRSVRDLGRVTIGCPGISGESRSRSSAWLPVVLDVGHVGAPVLLITAAPVENFPAPLRGRLRTPRVLSR